MRFVEEWVNVSSKPNISFHYISSSDISENSRMMWARQKVLAEKSLFAFANGRKLKVIAYRPDYIGPTKEDAHIGQNLIFWFFRPVGAAVRAKMATNSEPGASFDIVMPMSNASNELPWMAALNC
jgi:hypothetical protein